MRGHRPQPLGLAGVATELIHLGAGERTCQGIPDFGKLRGRQGGQRDLLRKAYGRGRWRKRKGVGTVRLPNGNLRRVELHWYEAHGIGKRDLKIKNYLDKS